MPSFLQHCAAGLSPL
uniref:Uncharacterized protein n=1 Tax=Rhizophora mucronata TaxID=61149 RepID=A0A2P2IZL4_RHIMU